VPERIIVGIDVGTTKVCVLVGEQDRNGKLNILGTGLCPSRGLRRGVVINMSETVESITSALDRSERLSGRKIASAYVGVAGSHIESLNSRGVVAISPNTREIVPSDISRAIEAARAIEVPSSREVIHVIPRGYLVDGQEGVKNPIGMSGYRLEVECHIVTGAVASIQNLIKCVQKSQVEIDDLVLEPLASSEAVLSPTEKDLGVVLLDIGGGTTDVAIFVEGAIWHTVVLPLGGNLITNDIAYGLRIPFLAAEDLKVTHGHADLSQIPVGTRIDLEPFVPDCKEDADQHALAEIIEARVEEIFEKVREEITKSGYDGLLPSGIVITGGTAELPGIVEKARETFNLPVRIGTPRGIHGVVDTMVNKPAFATGVGLLQWGLRQREALAADEARSQEVPMVYQRFKQWLQEFLP
jgi:cell division protein FtsA